MRIYQYTLILNPKINYPSGLEEYGGRVGVTIDNQLRVDFQREDRSLEAAIKMSAVHVNGAGFTVKEIRINPYQL